MIVQFRNEKVTNHGSIPIKIDYNVVAFIVFEEGFHQPIKQPKQIRLTVNHQRLRLRWDHEHRAWQTNPALFCGTMLVTFVLDDMPVNTTFQSAVSNDIVA
ncbi:hypothetical protein TNCV_3657141 [Trichonephila clavipes]|nr:hypothetical protein TNCV_3657141 [Trichonephila clavipes]